MNEYPTDDEVAAVRNWKFDEPGSFVKFLEYVKAIGHYWPMDMFGWSQEGRTYHISTGGWSGNEEILGAMQDNFIFWSVCWRSSRRGGHFVFEVPDDSTYFTKKPESQP